MLIGTEPASPYEEVKNDQRPTFRNLKTNLVAPDPVERIDTEQSNQNSQLVLNLQLIGSQDYTPPSRQPQGSATA